MLVLTRTPGEKIRINDDVIIELIFIKGAQAKLGIEAPIYIPVHREEIYQRILKEGPTKELIPNILDDSINELINNIIEAYQYIKTSIVSIEPDLSPIIEAKEVFKEKLRRIINQRGVKDEQNN